MLKKVMKISVKEVFEKWDLHCEIIGEVTDDGMLHIDYQRRTQSNNASV
ncbi:MAG: hypothetical protein MZV64_65935 [Ignavibacteriales bacterium]|nr:hypothetical protein [Ignavibacteriales bacterium]